MILSNVQILDKTRRIKLATIKKKKKLSVTINWLTSFLGPRSVVTAVSLELPRHSDDTSVSARTESSSLIRWKLKKKNRRNKKNVLFFDEVYLRPFRCIVCYSTAEMPSSLRVSFRSLYYSLRMRVRRSRASARAGWAKCALGLFGVRHAWWNTMWALIRALHARKNTPKDTERCNFS